MSRKISNRKVILVNLFGTLRRSFGCLKIYYPHDRVDRSFVQIYKSNNWLKRHGYPKRRKPFVHGWVLEEEYEKILIEMIRMGLPVEQELEEARDWRKKSNNSMLRK